MSDFSKCIVYTMRYEGINISENDSYINNSEDGILKYGLSYEFIKNTGDLNLFDNDKNKNISKDDIKNLKFDDAILAYKKYFWDYYKLDEIEDNKKAFLVFDACVNHGYRGSTKLLQRVLNICGYNLKIDGVYGTKTFDALKKCQSDIFVTTMLDKRESLYKAIVRHDKTQEIYLTCWLNRIKSIKRDINYV